MGRQEWEGGYGEVCEGRNGKAGMGRQGWDEMNGKGGMGRQGWDGKGGMGGMGRKGCEGKGRSGWEGNMIYVNVGEKMNNF